MVPILLALSPVAFVTFMALRDLRPWWRQWKRIRALPEVEPREVRR